MFARYKIYDMGACLRGRTLGTFKQGVSKHRQKGVYPYPLGAGLRDQIQKKALQTQKILVYRVYSDQREIKTMASEGARPWSMG